MATPLLIQYRVTINHVRKDNDELITSIDTYFSDGTTCAIQDQIYEPVGYEFDAGSAPDDFEVTKDTTITLYYYKLATIITNHYAKNQSQTLLGSNINEGNRFRVGTEIDLSQFANTYTNYTYSNNSGVSSDNELYIIQDGINEINYFYNPSFETTYTITCNYYKGSTADESLLYTSKEYSGLAPNSTFDPFDKIIVIPGYDYYSCTETDPFTVTVNKSVDYFYKEAQSYTLTVYHEDIDNKGMSIATAVPHYGIREGTAINPADYQLADEYLPEGWVYVEGTSIDKLTQDSSITCYYKKYNHTITYYYKEETTNTTIQSPSTMQYMTGEQVQINLNNISYFIENYKLVAIQKDNEEKSSSNIEFIINSDVIITLWYKSTIHNHNFTYDKTIPATCLSKGYELWICSCGQTEHRDQTNSLEHDYPLEWTITIEPTETTPGQKTRTCKRCGVKENQVLPASGTLVESIDQITLQSKEENYYPTTTYDMIIVSKTNTDKLINVGAAAPSSLSEGSIYIEGGISVKSNLNSGWLCRTKDGTNRRISPKTTVDLIVLNQNNAKAFIVEPSAPTGIPGPAGTLYFVIGE